MDRKRCPRCCPPGKTLPASAFARVAGRPGGLAGWCKACLTAAVKARRDRLHLAAVAAYGWPCACCGEARPEFLAAGTDTAALRPAAVVCLRRRGWPAGPVVLCHNCRHARRVYGHCPHQGD